MEIDAEWYLANQILPPISRLCVPIDGTDQSILAECLGLDPAKYAQHQIRARENDGDFSLPTSVRLNDEDKYKDVEKLKLMCPSCRAFQVRTVKVGA